jgi:hypothetical protein
MILNTKSISEIKDYQEKKASRGFSFILAK